jgi:Domain of unknown function (DUF4136)
MRTVAFVLAAASLAGCSTVSVRATPAPGANLTQLHTFALMLPQRSDSRAAEYARSPAGQTVREQLKGDLTAKGYTLAQNGVQPDFLVAVRSRQEQRTEIEDLGYAGPYWGWDWGWGMGWGWPADTVVRHYTEGTLIVDFVDPRTREVLWRGTASGIVDHPDNPSLKQVSKAVDKLMTRLPPSQLAATERTNL